MCLCSSGKGAKRIRDELAQVLVIANNMLKKTIGEEPAGNFPEASSASPEPWFSWNTSTIGNTIGNTSG